MKLDQVLNQDVAQSNSNVEDKILSIKDISVLVNPYFYIKKGKLVEYIKSFKVDGQLSIGLALVLEESTSRDYEAFVCPLTFEKPNLKNERYRLAIGELPSIRSNEIVYAKLDQIRALDKKRIIKSSLENHNLGIVPYEVITQIELVYYNLLFKGNPTLSKSVISKQIMC